MRLRTLFTIPCAMAALSFCAPVAAAEEKTAEARSGGAVYGPDDPALTAVVPGDKAILQSNGMAAAPELAPEPVKQAIWAANEIVGKPYVYGGGHNAKFRSRGYDCSGAVSYALHGGRLLESPLDSSSFMRWGERGRGRWITVYTNPGHAFVVIAGLRFDTGGRDRVARRRGRAGSGPRWAGRRSTRGYRARHPLGF